MAFGSISLPYTIIRPTLLQHRERESGGVCLQLFASQRRSYSCCQHRGERGRESQKHSHTQIIIATNFFTFLFQKKKQNKTKDSFLCTIAHCAIGCHCFHLLLLNRPLEIPESIHPSIHPGQARPSQSAGQSFGQSFARPHQ